MTDAHKGEYPQANAQALDNVIARVKNTLAARFLSGKEKRTIASVRKGVKKLQTRLSPGATNETNQEVVNDLTKVLERRFNRAIWLIGRNSDK